MRNPQLKCIRPRLGSLNVHEQDIPLRRGLKRRFWNVPSRDQLPDAPRHGHLRAEQGLQVRHLCAPDDSSPCERCRYGQGIVQTPQQYRLPASRYGGPGPGLGQRADPSIINVQNFQIQSMQAWLEANPLLAGDTTKCYQATYSEPNGITPQGPAQAQGPQSATPTSNKLSPVAIVFIVIGSVMGALCIVLVIGVALLLYMKYKKKHAQATDVSDAERERSEVLVQAYKARLVELNRLRCERDAIPWWDFWKRSAADAAVHEAEVVVAASKASV